MGAISIFLITIISAASGIIDLATASIIGAVAMIAGRILSINRASSAIDRRIFITIACMLAYGTALESSGAAQLIVKNLLTFLIFKILLVIFQCAGSFHFWYSFSWVVWGNWRNSNW